MVFFVMERKKTDVLLQPWASSRPRLAGASQVVFIMRQSRIQILGCGCSPHLADWMRRRATSRRWEVKVQKTHRNVSFLKHRIFAPVSRPAKFLTCLCFGGRVNRWLHVMRSGAPWTPRVIAVSATSRRCCATSVCIHQRYTRPAHFTMRVQMLTGFTHWHFTNVRWTAYECVRKWHFYCTAMLRFGLRSSSPPLSSWDPR